MGRWQSLSVGFAAMASPCEILLDGQDEAVLRAAAQDAIAEVRRIEHRYSRYRANSIVARINAAAGTGERVALDAEAASLIRFCADLWQASDGLFDITSGVLRRAWDFRAARLPGPGEVEALLPLVGWQQVEWNRPHLRLPRAGMELDFARHINVTVQFERFLARLLARKPEDRFESAQQALAALNGASVGPRAKGTVNPVLVFGLIGATVMGVLGAALVASRSFPGSFMVSTAACTAFCSAMQSGHSGSNVCSAMSPSHPGPGYRTTIRHDRAPLVINP